MTTMTTINLTPHAIVLNSGESFPPSGQLARVSATFTPFENGVCEQVYGEIENLPSPTEGTRYIVSGLVLAALRGSRPDVVAPATGHPEVVRNEKGQIVSVPGFVR